MLPLALPFLALLASAPARATCTLAALETTVRRVDGGLRRSDRWSWRVEGGVVDCATVDFASPEGAPVLARAARIDRPDARDRVLDDARWEAVVQAADPGFGPSPGLRLHAPELREGDLLVVELDRAWPAEALPAGDGYTWRPGARGALEVATLEAPADLPVALAGAAATPQLDGGVARWWLEPVAASRPEPHATPLPAAQRDGLPASRWSHAVALLLPARKPLLALGDARRSRTLRAWRQQGGGERLVALPGVAGAWCDAGGAPCPVVGGVAWRVDADRGAEWGWVEAGTWIAGEVEVPPAVEAMVAVLAPGAEVVLHAPWGGLAAGAVDGGVASELLPATLPAGVQAPTQGQLGLLEGPGAVGWRLRRVDGVGVLPDRRAAEQLVARLAVQASIPEPGPGAALKGRREDPSVIEELLAALHARMRPGALPGAPQLGPRTLARARRSGWGTPWEVALVLGRYLGQLKLDAVPLPVRPRDLGPPDPASVQGWPEALVAVRLEGGQTRWIDPSCLVCGPGQLRPRFDRAWTLSPGLPALPALPASTWHRRWRGATAIEVEVGGPLAVELRARLARVPPAQRRAWLAAELAAPGATLAEEEGLSTAGPALRLRFEAVEGPLAPPLRAPAPGLAGPAFLPAAGTWVEERPFPGEAAAVVIEAPGLRWTRQARDGAWREELVVEDRQVERAPAVQLLDRLERAWGQPPA